MSCPLLKNYVHKGIPPKHQLPKSHAKQKSHKYRDGILVQIGNNNKIFLSVDGAAIFEKQNGQRTVLFADSRMLYNQRTGNMVTYYPNKIIGLYHYRHGNLHQNQLVYDIQNEIICRSIYQYNQLKEILQIYNTDNSYNSQQFNLYCIKQICKHIHKYKSEFQSMLNRILIKSIPFKPTFKVNQQFVFYGQNKHSVQGWGILLSQNETFYGQFHQGFINGFGFAKFSDDNTELGQFEDGILISNHTISQQNQSYLQGKSSWQPYYNRHISMTQLLNKEQLHQIRTQFPSNQQSQQFFKESPRKRSKFSFKDNDLFLSRSHTLNENSQEKQKTTPRIFGLRKRKFTLPNISIERINSTRRQTVFNNDKCILRETIEQQDGF